MNCLNQEELIGLALGRDDGLASPHLAICATCRASLEDGRRLAERVAAAHQVFDKAHAAGRERLMAALAREPVSESRFPVRKGRLSMKQRIAFSSMAVAATLLLAAWLVLSGRPLSAMEQVAAKIREAKSFSFDMAYEMEGAEDKPRPGGKFYWQAPGTVRLEDTALPDGNSMVMIFPYRRPGIEIDEKHKTYQRVPAREGYTSPLMAVWKLGGFSGKADKELEPRKIDDRPTRGFQIAAKKIDADLDGALDIWIDAETNFPVFVEYQMQWPKAKMTMHHFHWNEPLDANLFDTSPPEGYADKTPKRLSVDEVVEDIRQALKFYAEVMGGHYPRVKMVYGDVTMNELWQKLGIDTRHMTDEQIRSDAYVKSLKATRGFGQINGILRDNADAAYYGKTVGPNDKDKVLLRWKLDDGNYRVIYGDLHSQTLAAERLKALESR